MESYIVAYLDMLGTKQKILSESAELYLRRLFDVYQDVYKIFEEKVDLFGNMVFLSSENLHIKIFSDNIVIAMKITKNQNNNVNDFKNLLAFIGIFQYKTTFIDNWLIRGAITKGKFHKDKQFVRGEALKRVVQLEEKTAIYPRIIIDECLKEDIESDGLSETFLKKDFDNISFVDYVKIVINKSKFLEEENQIPDVKNHKQTLFDEARDLGSLVIEVKQKLDWHSSYLEQCSDFFRQSVDKEERTNDK